MRLGYNTNGLADHDLSSAIDVVATLGYQAIAITLDHHTLNPFGQHLERELEQTRHQLQQHRLTPVIETGARYLLDPWRKHQPTLVSAAAEARAIRVDFLKRAIDIAALVDAACVSFWSGAADDEVDQRVATARLTESLRPVIDYAASRHVVLAFEPEPGHAIDTMESYARLLEAMDADDASRLRLTIDIGHLHCQGEVPIAQQLRTWGPRLQNVHIEDMRRGVHEHLPFGEGEIDFPPVLAALRDIAYTGPATVELPRHSHSGPQTAERALQFLRGALSDARI